MSEFGHRQSEFERQERDVSSALIADDSVFELVAENMQFDVDSDSPIMRPDFCLRPCYSGKIPDELDESEYIPITLQIEGSGNQNPSETPELSYSFATYSYIKFGFMKKDSSDLHLYDAAGRLHQVEKDEEGKFIAKKDSPFDIRKAKALTAWEEAHNTMIRAARINPAIHVDPILGTWTDKHEEMNIPIGDL